jgi:hypothetical protein
METKLGVVDAPEADPKLTPEEAKVRDDWSNQCVCVLMYVTAAGSHDYDLMF